MVRNILELCYTNSHKMLLANPENGEFSIHEAKHVCPNNRFFCNQLEPLYLITPPKLPSSLLGYDFGTFTSTTNYLVLGSQITLNAGI